MEQILTIKNIYNIITDEISTNHRVILHTCKSLIIPHYRAFAIYNETTISCHILRYFISDIYVFITYNGYKRSEQCSRCNIIPYIPYDILSQGIPLFKNRTVKIILSKSAYSVDSNHAYPQRRTLYHILQSGHPFFQI